MQPLLKKVRYRDGLTLRQKRKRASMTLKISSVFFSIILLTGMILGGV